MAQSIPKAGSCCDEPQCDSPAQIPGPQGEPGENGADGKDGINAYTDLTASFIQPDIGDDVAITVEYSTWIGVGQIVFVEGGGYYEVISKADSTHATIQNLGYTGNAPATTVVPNSSQVIPGGIKGVNGSSAGGDMLGSNNLSDVDSAATSRTNLGLGTIAVEDAADFLAAANNLSDVGNAATSRTNLGAAASGLATASGLTTSVTDVVIGRSSGGGGAVQEIAATSFGRSLIGAADSSALLTLLGKLAPRYGVIGYVAGVNLNSAGDNLVSVISTKYRIERITAANRVGATADTASAGAFTAVGGGGTHIAEDQTLSGFAGSGGINDLVLEAITNTNLFTNGNLYIRIGTPSGAAATADFFILGMRVD